MRIFCEEDFPRLRQKLNILEKMVSFVCNACQETIKKPKLDQHRQRCFHAQFACVDCMKDFYGDEYRTHTQCISEA